MRKIRPLLLIALIAILGGSVIAVNYWRDTLVASLLEEANGNISGRIEYHKVHLSSIREFPLISLRFNDIVLYLNKSRSSNDTVAFVNEMFLLVDLNSTLDDSYDISEVRLNGGQVVLEDKLDGKLGIEEALSSNAQPDARDPKPKRRLVLTIDTVKIKDFEFIYRNQRFKDELRLNIEELNAGFEQRGDSTIAKAFLVTDLQERFNRTDSLHQGKRFEAKINAQAHVLVTREWLQLGQIDFRAKDAVYFTDAENITLGSAHILSDSLSFQLRQGVSFFNGLSMSGQLSFNDFAFKQWKIPRTEIPIGVNHGEYRFTPQTKKWFGKEATGGTIRMRPFAETPSFQIDYLIEQFDIEDLMESTLDSIPFYGKASFETHLNTKGDSRAELLNNLNGTLRLSGEDLVLTDMDIDKFIRRFQRSQNFNLVDVGAVLIAGPIGLAATKGGAYASLALFSKGDTTFVPNFLSDLSIERGEVALSDVAFATHESRISSSGFIDLSKDTLAVSIDVINNQGCSIIGQQMTGSLEAPEKSKVQVVKTLLGPVNNLLINIMVIDCPVVYSGSVPPPEPKKGKLRLRKSKSTEQ